VAEKYSWDLVAVHHAAAQLCCTIIHTQKADRFEFPYEKPPSFHVIAEVRVVLLLYNGVQRPRLEFEVREITRIADDKICELAPGGGWWHTGSQSGKRCFVLMS
jgi:hypothetical protein